jgi:molybdenum cofactor cytidylyltransferase
LRELQAYVTALYGHGDRQRHKPGFLSHSFPLSQGAILFDRFVVFIILDFGGNAKGFAWGIGDGCIRLPQRHFVKSAQPTPQLMPLCRRFVQRRPHQAKNIVRRGESQNPDEHEKLRVDRMKFGAVPIEQSLGGIVAHRVKLGQFVLAKGEVVTSGHIAALRELGIADIVVARMEKEEVGEDAAAIAVAEALAGDNIAVRSPATGRVNLHAKRNGIFVADRQLIDRLNDVDEAITLATVPAMSAVLEGDMVATVKIIPFAVSQSSLAAALAVACDCRLSTAAYQPQRIGVVSTLLPGLKTSVIDKTLRVLADRIAPSGSCIAVDERVEHEAATLAQTIASVARVAELVIVFGASAITDRRDVIPAAIEACGGHIIQFGMPVDPGNLLLLARLDDATPILGAPGCARSCKENGFDWVLGRMLARLPVTSRDIRRMGAGGLITKPTRQPKSDAQARITERSQNAERYIDIHPPHELGEMGL